MLAFLRSLLCRWRGCVPSAEPEIASGIVSEDGFELVWRRCVRCTAPLVRMERDVRWL